MSGVAELALLAVAMFPLLAVAWLLLGSAAALTAMALTAVVSRLLPRHPRR